LYTCHRSGNEQPHRLCFTVSNVNPQLKKTAKDFNEAEGPVIPTTTKATSNKRKKADDDEEGEPEVKQARPKRGKKVDLVIKTIEKDEAEENE